jgi:hypothetical protein
MAAAAAGHVEIVKALLGAGADAGIVDPQHRTARDIARLANQTATAALFDR